MRDPIVIPMTEQEIVDYVFLKVWEQGKQSRMSSERGKCAYRGHNNLKCAVGWLIPDDKYTLEMEGLPVHMLVKNAYLKVTENRMQFILEEMQYWHDKTPTGGFTSQKGYRFRDQWLEGITEICTKLKLTMPPIPKESN